MLLSLLRLQSSPEDLALRLASAPALRDSRRFSRPRQASTAFTIEHYAGAVQYSTENLMGKNKEDAKVVQELMRHASSRITLDVYQHGDEDAKRSALGHLSSLFDLPATAQSSDK